MCAPDSISDYGMKILKLIKEVLCKMCHWRDTRLKYRDKDICANFAPEVRRQMKCSQKNFFPQAKGIEVCFLISKLGATVAEW